jgi:hypothetical protein
MSAPNKYGVHNRLNLLESRCTALEQQNAELRTHFWTALETKTNDLKNVIQDSIRIPVDGIPGKDGRDGVDGQSIVGPRGERGDVLIVSESQLAAAVIALRRKMLEQRAAFIAVIVQRIEHEKKSDKKVNQHFARQLEYILKEIECLK